MKYFFEYPLLPDLLFSFWFLLSLLSCNLFTWEDITEGAIKTFPWTCYVQGKGFSIQDLANQCCQQQRGQEASNSSITRIPKKGAQGICLLAWPGKERCVHTAHPDTCTQLISTKQQFKRNKNTSRSNMLELHLKTIVKSHWLQAKHTFACSAEHSLLCLSSTSQRGAAISWGESFVKEKELPLPFCHTAKILLMRNSSDLQSFRKWQISPPPS